VYHPMHPLIASQYLSSGRSPMSWPNGSSCSKKHGVNEKEKRDFFCYMTIQLVCRS
jgi:hypothetical protein